MLLAALLLSAVVLRDDVNVVPPGQWRYDEFILKDQIPATVDCVFRVDSPAHAHIELVTRDDLREMLRGKPHEAIASAPGPQAGKLRQEIREPGSYALVIVNEDRRRPARVALRLSLDFSARLQTKARYLEPQRKLAVIVLSFAGFLAIVTLSARKLLGAVWGRL